MPLQIDFAASPGRSFFATAVRRGDDFIWNAVESAWQAAPPAIEQRIILTEGAGNRAGSYSGEAAGMGTTEVVVFIHDDADAADGTVLVAAASLIDGAEAASVEPFVAGSVSDLTPAAGEFTGAAGLSAVDGFFEEQWLAFTSGALKGVARKITDYAGASRTFTFSGSGTADDAPFPTAPADGDSFLIVGHG